MENNNNEDSIWDNYKNPKEGEISPEEYFGINKEDLEETANKVFYGKGLMSQIQQQHVRPFTPPSLAEARKIIERAEAQRKESKERKNTINVSAEAYEKLEKIFKQEQERMAGVLKIKYEDR